MGQINTTNYPTVASLADDDLLIVENAQNGTGTTTPKQLRENAIGTGTLDTQAQTVIGAINEVNAHTDVPIATTSTPGKVKPDGTTITVDSSGKIASVDQTPIATTSTAGKVKPDGTTITVNSSGTISSVDQTPIATTSVAVKVKPDGSTITVNSSGTISSVDQTPIATTSTAGKVKPDGTTITINSSGVITSVGGGTTVVANPTGVIGGGRLQYIKIGDTSYTVGDGTLIMSKKRYQVYSSSWSTSQSGGYYTYNLSLSTPQLNTSYPPNVYISGSGDTTEPTDTHKAMYALLVKCNLSSTNRLVLYAKVKPTSSFYIYVEGVAV